MSERLNHNYLPLLRRHVVARLCTAALTLLAPVFALGADKKQAPTVKTFQVSVEQQENVISGMGSISCPHSIELGFDDTGVISEMRVEEGESVAQGQVIAKLDDSSFQGARVVADAKLKAAVAELNFYKNELEKKEGLFHKRAISDAEYKRALFEMEKAEAAVAVARAELRRIDIELRKRTLTAPISGVIAKRFLDIGSPVAPGSNKAVLLIQCNDVFADIEFGERLFPSLRIGQPVRVKIDALGGEVFQGRLVRIGAEIDKKNRTFIAKVRMENPRLIIRPGMFARSEIIVSEGSAPILVPRQALLENSMAGSEGFVMLVKNGVTLKKRVSLGTVTDDKVQVLSGLTPGDLVVMNGGANLRELTDVNVEIVAK